MSNTLRGPLRPGARVGAFVVREEIGCGATSVVYEAEHRTLRHPVAVKVLRSSSETARELRMRFEREMRLCTSLRSLHVPHVYEVGELPSGLPYIVMERLSGATLADWLGMYRKLPVAVVVEIGIQLCTALSALHEREVLHRDVKPENLVLHRAFADGYVLKLVDFGICKPLVPDGLSPTQQGTVIGTPEYMSPEQVQGIDVDVRTDVYSTGVVLYELLTGRTPFAGHDLDRLGRAILFASPPRPSSLRPEVSAVLEAIVLRAMARERTDRHPSMIALQRDLERFAEEHALRRHPSVWALLPAAGTVRPPPPPSDARPARDTQATVEVPRLPVRRGAVAGAVVGALAVLLTAASIVAYYVYDPFASARRDRATVVPWVPEPEPAPTLAPAALELGPLAPDAPHGTSPSPASRDASSGGAPSATPRTDAPSRSEAAEQREPVRAAATVDETARQSLEARRERAREHRRAARRRARRAAARRATTPPATTVAFAPSAPVGATAVAPPLAEQPVASVTAADLYAQVGAQPRPSSAPAVPRSPYDDAARAIPESPYGTDGDGEAADPF